MFQKERLSEISTVHKATGTRLHNEWRAMWPDVYLLAVIMNIVAESKGVREWINDFEAFKQWAIKKWLCR